MKNKQQHDRSKRQRFKYFSFNLIAFAAVFIALGFITLQILHLTAYSETDISLENLAEDSQLIQEEIQRNSNQLAGNQVIPDRPNEPGLNRFNSQIILWNDNGDILNEEGLGNLYSQISNLNLSTENLNEIEEVSITNDQDQYNFRTITNTAPENDENVAYFTVIANTNQIENAVSNFQNILILCLIIFWLLSIGISYQLSKVNMQPILSAWRKQQEFVENASHELRTPLTIIQNNLDHLFTKPQSKIIDESESIAQALNETRRLSGLTTDLLTIARGDANEQTLNLTLTDVQPFIAETTSPFMELASMNDKQVIVDNEGKAIVKVDQKKLHQVMIILLDNALKYTEAGDTITVKSHISKKHWYIYVNNTGASIAEAEKDRIFDRFYRDANSRASTTSGYGLGLAIAKQIVENHGGHITVENLLKEGVSFKIRLRKNDH